MALSKFGFIVSGVSVEQRLVMNAPGFEMIVVGVPTPEDGIDAARKLVDEGIELLELCGGFGPIWTGKVIEEIMGCIPVGSVGYGPESIEGMYELFKEEDSAQS